jgi:hypothetical protein
MTGWGRNKAMGLTEVTEILSSPFLLQRRERVPSPWLQLHVQVASQFSSREATSRAA